MKTTEVLMHPAFVIGAYLMFGAIIFHAKTVIHKEERDGIDGLLKGESPLRMLMIYVLAYSMWPYIMGVLFVHQIRRIPWLIKAYKYKRKAVFYRRKAEKLRKEMKDERFNVDDPEQRE